MKDELHEKIVKFVGLKAKTYSYLIDDGSEDKKTPKSYKEVYDKNLKFKSLKSVQKQPNLRIK